MKTDIQTKEDIKLLVDSFYSKVNADELLAPVFNIEAGTDWVHHMPKMYQFWGTQLIGTMDYQGAPFPPHTKVAITTLHFKRWLKLFFETIDEHFEDRPFLHRSPPHSLEPEPSRLTRLRCAEFLMLLSTSQRLQC